jgi:hypothetical protein
MARTKQARTRWNRTRRSTLGDQGRSQDQIGGDMDRRTKLETLEELWRRLSELGADCAIMDDALEVSTEYSSLVIDHDHDGWHFRHSSDPLYFSPEDPTACPRLWDLVIAIDRAFKNEFPGCQSGWRPTIEHTDD